MPLRRWCPRWPGRRLPRATPCRSGYPAAATGPGVRATRARPSPLRTEGSAVTAETPNAAAAPAARPYRRPDHKAGPRRPSGERVIATSPVPNDAFGSGCHRTRGAAKLHPTNAAANPAARNLLGCISIRALRRSRSFPERCGCVRCRRASTRRVRRRPPSRRARNRRSCGRARREPTRHWSCRRPPART